jgi:hypothetical protein
MSDRGAAARRAVEKMAQETELAEERGAERLRGRLREMLEERRRVVRLGEHQIEVVEVNAVEAVLGEEIEDADGQSS